MIKFKLEPYNRNISDNELISDIRRVASKLKKKTKKIKLKIKLTGREYRKHGKYSPKAHVRRFGGWLYALDKAGLQRTVNIPAEEYLKNLEKVWRKLRRQPRNRDMSKPISRFSGRSYSRLFGSWRNALITFVEYINCPKDSSRSSKKIRHELQSKLNRQRRKLVKRTIGLQMRFLILKRDNFRCRLCGRSPSLDPEVKLHIDHIIPADKGDETIPENLQTLCSECNIGKSNTLLGVH